MLTQILHDDPSITVDGKLNAAKIIEKDPAHNEVLNVGAQYLRIPRWFMRQHAGLEDVIQSAGNLAQNVSKIEHDGQKLKKVSRDITAGRNFAYIKDRASKSRMKNIESLQGMFNFARKYGGGLNMSLIGDTADFIRGQSNSVRKVGPNEWDALALDFRGMDQAVQVRHGVVAGLYCDSNDKLWSLGDIKSLNTFNMLPKVRDMDKAIDEVITSFGTTGAEHAADITNASCKLRSAGAALVAGKKSDGILEILNGYEVGLDKLFFHHLAWCAMSMLEKVVNKKLMPSGIMCA